MEEALQGTLLAGKSHQNWLEVSGGVLASCISCRVRSSSIIGATAAAGLYHGAKGKPLQTGLQG